MKTINPNQVAPNFLIQEFVSKDIFNRWGINSRWFVDPKLISLAQSTRDFLSNHYGRPVSMTINNWSSGGTRIASGFREPSSKTGGALSQHRFGRAMDIQFRSNGNTIPVKEIYDLILNNESVFIDFGLTTLEDIRDTPTWLHMDIRNTNQTKILIVRP
jgi:hypothetical protein